MMTQGERVKEVRKSLGLTLEKFGEKLGVKKNAISQIETGRNSLTDQMQKAICREFNVNYEWLTKGDGEIFIETDDDIIEIIDRIMIGENEFHKNLFKTFAQLDESELVALERIIDKFIEIRKEKN